MRHDETQALHRMASGRHPGRAFLAKGSTPLAIAVMAVLGQAAQAATIQVTTTNREINDDAFCSLQEAIYAANRDDNQAPDPTNPGALVTTGCTAGSGADVIYLQPGSVLTITDPIDDYDNYLGPTATPIVTSTIVIEGQGARLQRSSLGRNTRAFAVGPSGNLTIHELHVKGFAIRGGNGNDGGGGGMGAGGAIYAYRGSLTIGWSTFEDNRAEGGYGWYIDTIAGGGGGGLSGAGGAASGLFDTGGGGGGSRGSGAAGGGRYAGGGGGTATSAVEATPGQAGGGAGGVAGNFGAVDGHDAGNGGGGGGGTSRVPFFDPFCGGAGGNGGYGGGGGGGGDSGDGGHGGFGGGGGGGGGDGDFGGGGGSKEGCSPTRAVGQGGTFAGDGGIFGGGGGAGLGGAIFGHEATIDIENSTFTANWVIRGLGGDPGGIGPNGEGASRDGRGAGGAIFTVGGVLTIDNSTIAGNASNEYNLDPDTGEKVGLGGGGIVVYDPIGDVEATFRLRNSIVAGNDNSECYTRNGVDTAGSEGNLIVDNAVNTNDDPPCPGVVSSDDPLLAALAINAPGRVPTLRLGAGSPAIDAAVGNYTADDQRGILRPQGENGDIGAYEASGESPTTTIVLDPASPNGDNGWYVSTVGVTVSATDPDSANVETRCAINPPSVPMAFSDLPASCAVSSVSVDRPQHVIYAASRDENGNTDASIVSAMFKRDATAPALSPALNVPSPVLVGQAGVTAAANASDATSGVATSSCGSVDTSTAGARTVSCTATDNAGNSASATLAYVVQYRILGFFSPVPLSKWKAGQTVPVKIALGDAAGNRISDAEGAMLAQACRVTFQAHGAQSRGPDCMKYDPVYDQFTYNWKLGRGGTGSASIVTRVSYPGTAVGTQLSVPITIIR